MTQVIRMQTSACPQCGGPTPSAAQCPACAARERRMFGSELRLSVPSDALEREAENVSQTLSSGGAVSGAAAGELGTPAINRSASEAPGIVRNALAGGGRRLDRHLREDLERRMGFDFSSVRVHDGDAAAGSAAALSARAYTFGQHVVFGRGQYRPASADGRRLLAHELTHVMQQTGGRRHTLKLEPGPTGEVATLGTIGSAISLGVLSRSPIVQRDFAKEPPHPAAAPVALTPAQMQEAIDFNERVVTVIGTDGVSELRDVLGISPTPPDIDGAFVEAVLRWQAVQGFTRTEQDGKLGPRTARLLFEEIGAENVGRGEVSDGPRYTPGATQAPPVVGGQQQAAFRFSAEFNNDPANGIFASCCEVRQFVRWDAASAAALAGGRPHAGFPAGAAADTWFEDRNQADTIRYGHRTGRHAAPMTGNEYLDINGDRNSAYGHRFSGRDFPGGPDAVMAGSWRFLVKVVDVCNGGRTVGSQDVIRINW